MTSPLKAICPTTRASAPGCSTSTPDRLNSGNRPADSHLFALPRWPRRWLAPCRRTAPGEETPELAAVRLRKRA
eukprot:scaffold27464_cov107-Isochrysis_galbana.AAC.2